ncbi:DUF7336 domain-containing protein [Horticoccus sp. 23ND18S-11]
MDAIYLVTHSYERDGADEIKIIGAYASRRDAQLAVQRKRTFVGFSDHPRGFHIDRLEIGRDQWSEGFVTEPPPRRASTKSLRRANR